MRSPRWGTIAVVLGLWAAWACPGSSSSNSVCAREPSLAERVESQDMRIAELEQLLTQREQPFQVRSAGWNQETMARRLDVLEAAVRQQDKGGDEYWQEEWVDSHDQKWQSRIGGRILFDYVNFAKMNAGAAQELAELAPGTDLEDYAEFRRIRLFMSGTGYGVYDYRFELDFEPEADAIGDVQLPGAIPDDIDGLRFGSVSIRDMWIGIKDVPVLGWVRLGHFKEPFSLEEMTSANSITFMERALPNDAFVPARKVGIAALRHDACQRWTLGYGVFFNAVSDVAKERTSDQQGVDFAARVTGLPVYANAGRQLVHVGAGLSYRDDADDAVRFTARPEVHETRVNTGGLVNQQSVRLIDTGNLLADDYLTMNLEAAAVFGPASLQAEFFWNRVNDAGRNFYGGYIYGSYFLTGEHRTYQTSGGHFDRVTPLENFWIVDTVEGLCLGTGAWETAFRWSVLDLSGTPDDESGVQNDITLGVNWYWNPYARMMFNYIVSSNSYSNGDPRADLSTLALRWQVDW